MRFTTTLAAALVCAAAATAAAKPSPMPMPMPRGALGISVLSLTEPLKLFFGSGNDGVLVGDVIADSPAAKAGIHVGDVLIKVNGKPVDDVTGIRTVMSGAHKGDHARLEAIRDHRVVTLDATLDSDAPVFSFEVHRMTGDPVDIDRWMEHVEGELRELEQRTPHPSEAPVTSPPEKHT